MSSLSSESKAVKRFAVRLSASKKGSDRKPYLAKIGGSFADREFVRLKKSTNTTKAAYLDADLGDLIDGRGTVWTGDRFAGGYFLAVIIDHGLYEVSREEGLQILDRRRDGWTCTGTWTVDDGQTAQNAVTGDELGATPCPGDGDCSGLLFERDGRMELATPVGEGMRHRIARAARGRFPLATVAAVFPQLDIFDRQASDEDELSSPGGNTAQLEVETMTNEDTRKWKIVSDYLGNDPQPYTTKQLFDYAVECNAEHVDDADWTPFELCDMGDSILDLSHQQGNEGYLAAVPFEDEEDE